MHETSMCKFKEWHRADDDLKIAPATGLLCLPPHTNDRNPFYADRGRGHWTVDLVTNIEMVAKQAEEITDNVAKMSLMYAHAQNLPVTRLWKSKKLLNILVRRLIRSSIESMPLSGVCPQHSS